jgi:hypothetical protein
MLEFFDDHKAFMVSVQPEIQMTTPVNVWWKTVVTTSWLTV